MIDFNSFQIIKTNRKTISVQIKPDGSIIIRAPLLMKDNEIEKFVHEKEKLIEKHLANFEKRRSEISGKPSITATEIKDLAEKAKIYIPKRVDYFASLIGVTYGRITIRSQKTRWGSCSSSGNLNFNCLLMLCPNEVIDYVVVHELCHRKQLNHSKSFWAEVEKVMPDYKLHQKWLKENGSELIRRMVCN